MKEKMYENPNAELIAFDDDIVLSQVSGTCRCYLDMGVKDDYSAADTGCWTDSEDASEAMLHEGPTD